MSYKKVFCQVEGKCSAALCMVKNRHEAKNGESNQTFHKHLPDVSGPVRPHEQGT